LPEAASTNTTITTTATTRSRLQVCARACVQTFFFSKTLELCVCDFFYKDMNLREFCTELFLSFFLSFPSRALSKQIKSGILSDSDLKVFSSESKLVFFMQGGYYHCSREEAYTQFL
jgi:hypothetical protein